MKLGFIGLGRMGSNMVLNLSSHKHSIVVYNRSSDKTKQLIKKSKKIIPSYTYKEFSSKLGKKKIIWLMVDSKAVDIILKDLSKHLKIGDIVIDGGNSYFKDSIERYTQLKKKGIYFLDCGVSGGVSGARNGASTMVGGDKLVFKKVEILFKDISVKDGYGYIGKSGAGHFVKMVHNGIEYGMMGAIAEGFGAIDKHKSDFNLNSKEISKVYSNGSIIESKLMSLLNDAFKKPYYLRNIPCKVPKGETEDEMQKLEGLSDMPILHQARLMRIHSRIGKFCGTLISAMRTQFGQHEFKKK